MTSSQLYKCATCGHIIAATAVKCVGCGTPGPIARHPNNWRTVEPYEAIAPLLASERPSGFIQGVQSETRRPNYRKYVGISAGVIGAVLVLLFIIGVVVGPDAPKTSAPPVDASKASPSPESNSASPALAASDEQTAACAKQGELMATVAEKRDEGVPMAKMIEIITNSISKQEDQHDVIAAVQALYDNPAISPKMAGNAAQAGCQSSFKSADN
jgi:hypothetical protein